MQNHDTNRVSSMHTTQFINLTLDQYEQLVSIDLAFDALAKLGVVQSSTDFEYFIAIYEQLSKLLSFSMESIEIGNAESLKVLRS